MNHAMTRVSTGIKIDDTVQVICTCGWSGTAYPAWNDWQMTLVMEDEVKHRLEFS